MFSKIASHLSSKRLWKVLLLVSGCLLFASSFAVEAEQFQGDFIRNLTDIINILNLIVAMLTAPAAVLAGWLLTPDWTFGDFFGLREYLYEIWILVSNIVYIVFAIILLWMAANGIFHPGDTDYVIKKSLPRFLVAILMVPFTWFIVSFTLTIVNKGIAVVMSIPMGTIVAIAGQDEDSSWNRPVIPTKVELNFGEEGGAYGDPDNLKCIISGGSGTAVGVTGNGVPCITPAEFIGANPSGPFYMIMVYAYDIFKIQKADLIDTEQLCRQEKDYNKCIRWFTGLLARFFFSFIWAFFFSILLIGLAVVLLYRAFMLWIYIMFSPMFALTVFFKWKHNEKFTGMEVGFKQFFVLAAVPLMVAAILSFGLLFIGIIRDNPGQGGPSIFGTKEGGGASCTSGTWTVKFCFAPDGRDAQGDKYDSYLVIGGNGDEAENLNSGRSGATDYSITLEFGPMFSELIGSEAAEMAGGAIGSVQDIFSYAIMNTIALVIIWMATIAAIKNDKVLSTAFAPFENMGNQLGGILKKAPGLIKIPGTDLRLGWVNRAIWASGWSIDQTIGDSGRRFANEHLPGGSGNKFLQAMERFEEGSDKTRDNLAQTIRTNKADFDAANKTERDTLIDSIKSVAQRSGRPLSERDERNARAARSNEALAEALEPSLGNTSPIVSALRDNTQSNSDRSNNNSLRDISISGLNNAKIDSEGRISLDEDNESGARLRVDNGKLSINQVGQNGASIANNVREDFRKTLNAASIRDIAEARQNISKLSQKYDELDLDSLRDEVNRIESMRRSGTEQENDDAVLSEVQKALTDFVPDTPSES